MRWLLIVVMCTGLLAGVARADLEEGTYAPDIEAGDWMNTKELFDTETDEPISLTELRGMVVVLYFWVSWHAGGEYLMPLINQVENHPNLGRRRGVFVMGVTEADRSRVEEMIEEERIFFPIAMESKSHKEYDIHSFPRAVVIDPNGKIVYTGWPGRDRGEEFVNTIVDAVGDTPPTRTHPREAAECVRLLERARAAIREGDYKAANRVAREAEERALTGDALKTRCQDMLDLIAAIARDMLAQGMRLVDEKKYEEGIARLRDVKRLFRGQESGKTAYRRLNALEERYPDVKKVLEALRRDAEARGLLVAVREHLRARSFGEAWDTLENIIKEYDDTPVAADAQTILDRMKENQTITGYVRDHQASKDCRNWIGQARGFVRTGKLRKAKQLLRRVIDEYPDTRYTEEAYRLLGELP